MRSFFSFFSLLFIFTLLACGDGVGVREQASSGGQNAVARSSLLPTSDVDCLTGGVLVETGIDKNENSVLDAAEVDQIEKICNGTDGLQSLVSLSEEAIGSNCSFGGIRIEIGSDQNRNSVLDTGEITKKRFACTLSKELFAAKEKLLAAEAFDFFGSSVAISGDYAIVGAYQEDTKSTNAGAAYIFRRTGPNTWDTGTMLTAPDAEAFDNFGFSVAISGDYAVIGAWKESAEGSEAGAAYAFQRTSINAWDAGTKLTAFDAEANDRFGSYIAISGDYIIVGAHLEDTGGIETGAAYTFRRTGPNAWDTGTKLTAPDAEAFDFFGSSVAISENYAIVGAYGEDAGGTNAGAAYIFRRTGPDAWDAGIKITALDAEAGDRFGEAVAISGDYALVGAAEEDEGGKSAGAAYVFHRTGADVWGTGTKLIAPDADAGDRFGNSVAIAGNYIIAGAYLEDGESTDTGAAYVFRRTGLDTWISDTKITAPDTEAGDRFGFSVAISGTYAIVGAYLEDTGGLDAGAAYVVR